jgi:hypothetical protein
VDNRSRSGMHEPRMLVARRPPTAPDAVAEARSSRVTRQQPQHSQPTTNALAHDHLRAAELLCEILVVAILDHPAPDHRSLLGRERVEQGQRRPPRQDPRRSPLDRSRGRRKPTLAARSGHRRRRTPARPPNRFRAVPHPSTSTNPLTALLLIGAQEGFVTRIACEFSRFSPPPRPVARPASGRSPQAFGSNARGASARCVCRCRALLRRLGLNFPSPRGGAPPPGAR